MQFGTRGQSLIISWCHTLSLGLLACSAVPVRGESISCNLESCVAMATSNHPSLKAGEAKLDEAKANLGLQEAERLPSVKVEGAVGYFDGTSVGPQSVLRGISERVVSGGYYQAIPAATLPVYSEGTFIGQNPIAVRQAQHGLSEQEWDLQLLRIEVGNAVAESYFGVLKALRGDEIEQEVAELSEIGYRLAQAEYDKNLLSRSDLLQAEVKLVSARRDLSSLRIGLERSKKELCNALGREDACDVTVQDVPENDAPLPPLEELTAQFKKNHPEIKAQEFKVLAKHEEARLAETEYYPNVSLNVAYGHGDDLQMDPGSNSLWNAALQLDVPIFDFGRTSQKVAIIRAQAMYEEKHLHELRLAHEQDVIDAYYQIKELEPEMELLKKQIEQAEEELKLNRALYKRGALQVTELHASQISLLQYQLALNETENDQKLLRYGLQSGSVLTPRGGAQGGTGRGDSGRGSGYGGGGYSARAGGPSN